jgi:hypothetical protein
LAAASPQTEPALKRYRPEPAPEGKRFFARLPESQVELYRRCTYAQFAIVDLVLRRMHGSREFEWVRLQETEIAEILGITLQAVYQTLKDLCVRDGKPIPEGNLALLEVRGTGRNREYRAIEKNFTEAPVREKRKLQRKPPRSEGIEDAPARPRSGYAEVGSSLPVAALRHAAPNAVMVVFPGGRDPVPLAPGCPTCEVLKKYALENKELTVVFKLQLKNSSTGTDAGDPQRAKLLESIVAILQPFIPHDTLDPKSPLWGRICRKLGNTPDEVLLALIRRRKHAMDGYAMVERLAEQAAKTHAVVSTRGAEEDEGYRAQMDAQREEAEAIRRRDAGGSS